MLLHTTFLRYTLGNQPITQLEYVHYFLEGAMPWLFQGTEWWQRLCILHILVTHEALRYKPKIHWSEEPTHLINRLTVDYKGRYHQLHVGRWWDLDPWKVSRVINRCSISESPKRPWSPLQNILHGNAGPNMKAKQMDAMSASVLVFEAVENGHSSGCVAQLRMASPSSCSEKSVAARQYRTKYRIPVPNPRCANPWSWSYCTEIALGDSVARDTNVLSVSSSCSSASEVSFVIVNGDHVHLVAHISGHNTYKLLDQRHQGLWTPPGVPMLDPYLQNIQCHF